MYISFLFKEIMFSIFKDVNAWEIIGVGFFHPQEFSGFLKTLTSAASFLVSWAEEGGKYRENFFT
jgi:hypothetical protein